MSRSLIASAFYLHICPIQFKVKGKTFFRKKMRQNETFLVIDA